MTSVAGSTETVVTFLMTDVEGSTPLWELHPEAMDQAMERHHAIVAELVGLHDGHLPVDQGEGDARFAAFSDATNAVACSIAIQLAFSEEPWPAETPIRVRMGLHTGRAFVREGNYFGESVSRTARIRGLAVGGQILMSQSAYEAAKPEQLAAATVADLGLARLKGLSRPEQVFQVSQGRLPSEFPPLRTDDLRTNNLPSQTSSFVGRELLVVQAGKLLEADRLVTLTGAGGSGKTRLAIAVASNVVEVFPHGAWLVELAPVSNGGHVWEAIAKSLGVREEPGRDLDDTTVEYLRPKSALIVLDNCEHVVDKAAEAAHELLGSCPGVRVLATSRQSLGLPGEALLPVPPLDVPEETLDDPESLSLYGSVALFVDRARSVRPDFTLSVDNASAVADICRRLDGLPLAIELAASRAKALPMRTIAENLRARLAFLVGAGRGLSDRQQTLRATIEWSYDLLSETEQQLLRELSVLPGGFSLEFAAAISSQHESVQEVFPVVAQLLDKSLIEVANNRDRYWMLEMIREYGVERLREGTEDGRAFERLLHWLAETSEPEHAGSDQRWAERMRFETENVRAAFDWALAEGQIELALRAALGDAVEGLWSDLGYWSEGCRYLTELLGRWKQEDRLRGRAMTSLGSLESLQRDGQDRACATLTRAIEILRKVDDAWLAYALNALGDTLSLTGSPAEALPLLEEAVALMDSEKRPADELMAARHNLACARMSLGDTEYARSVFLENEQLARSTGHATMLAASLMFQGIIAAREQQPEEAEALMERSLHAAREARDLRFTSGALQSLESLAQRRGDHVLVRSRLEELVALWTEWDEVSEERLASPLVRLARSARWMGDLVGAKQALRAAASNVADDDVEAVAGLLRELGAIAVSDRRYRTAIECFETAAAVDRKRTETVVSVDAAAGGDEWEQLLHVARNHLEATEISGASARGSGRPLSAALVFARLEVQRM